MGTRDMRITRRRAARPFGSGSVRILIGFGLVVLAATSLLLLPIASEEGRSVNTLEAVFTAVSAICVTGLVVVETQTQWSFFGEAVILVVIQVGGLGYMAGMGIILWILGRNLGLRDRNLIRLYYGAPDMRESVSFVRVILIYTLIFEVLGAIALYIGFVVAGVPAGQGVWWAIFHAVSAFNVAGFNITGMDIVPFQEDPAVLLPIAILSIAGSVGSVPVILALFRFDPRRASLDAKLVLGGAALILVATSLFIGIDEWRNSATLGGVEPIHRPLLAFFQSAMWTSGLSAVDTGAFNQETKFLESGLMLVGGAAGSPAGGIKIATAVVVIMAAAATLRGREDVVILGREVPAATVRQAMTIALAFGAIFFLTTLLLLLTADATFIDVLYEAASATGTVGWSTGITSTLGDSSLVVLIVTMLLGRFLPLLLVLQMVRPKRGRRYKVPSEGVRFG